jgi:hypothetical protein
MKILLLFAKHLRDLELEVISKLLFSLCVFDMALGPCNKPFQGMQEVCFLFHLGATTHILTPILGPRCLQELWPRPRYTPTSGGLFPIHPSAQCSDFRTRSQHMLQGLLPAP